MKFFHVYNEECFKGLEINGLINKDTGFKIQHAFSVPLKRQFNEFAAEGSPLFDMIKNGNIPFYVDRIAGGITYYPYEFDKNLIAKYKELLGDWFLGFQLHESASNIRSCEWQFILNTMKSKGPYDPVKLEEVSRSSYAKAPDGTVLSNFSHGTAETYAKMTFAETHEEFLKEITDMFRLRMSETDGNILPCDSFYLLPKLQDELGMNTFMPEVGCQIPLMRVAIALARGQARASGKTWGAYYECWRLTPSMTYSMPCFNRDSINEWYLNQQIHPDDFTSYGEKGGSSRLLQERIYFHALMSGADYFSEEWGLNCSYTSMKTFELSHYGQVKKDFIRAAEGLRDVKAITPFAIVLPKRYLCVELPELFEVTAYNSFALGNHRDVYMRSPLTAEDKAYFGHIEDVIKLIYENYGERYGNEGHVLTNSRFGDIFDIIYEDADDKTLESYEYLIDATAEGSFISAKRNKGYKILDSSNIRELEEKLHALEKEALPCYVDGLHWLVSVDGSGQRYLTVFNNEGNERDLNEGDIIHREAEKTVEVTFKEDTDLKVLHGSNGVKTEKADGKRKYVTVPPAGFAVMTF